MSKKTYSNKTDEENEKSFNEKKDIILRQYALLIHFVNQAYLLKKQLQKNQNEEFEKGLMHAITLLVAARKEIEENGPTPYTDYFTDLAVSHIIQYLPQSSVVKIIDKLSIGKERTELKDKSNIPAINLKAPKGPKPRDSKQYIAEVLISRLNPIKFTSAESSLINTHRKQFVIDFCADLADFKKYGEKRAKKLGAHLIQARPNRFNAMNSIFSIETNTTLTFIGHCFSGSAYLSDNSGNRIFVSELAQQIYAKMLRKGTPLDTAFNIDLIACQAASSDGLKLSFAQRLLNELDKRGIRNAKITASPTIMTTTYDGSEANLTFDEDKSATREMVEGKPRLFTKGFFTSLFTKLSAPKLNVKKVTFKHKP